MTSSRHTSISHPTDATSRASGRRVSYLFRLLLSHCLSVPQLMTLAVIPQNPARAQATADSSRSTSALDRREEPLEWTRWLACEPGDVRFSKRHRDSGAVADVPSNCRFWRRT